MTLRLVKTDSCIECGIGIFEGLRCAACSFNAVAAKRRAAKLASHFKRTPVKHKLHLAQNQCLRCGRDLNTSEVDACVACVTVMQTGN